MKAPISYFVSGSLVGLLLATCGFAVVLRNLDDNGVESGGATTVLKLAHSLDQSHPVHLAMMRMADLVSEKSAGNVELQVIPNGQLGSETECIEQVQNGALAMTKTSTAALESFIPKMTVLGIPYIFRDSEHCWNVLDGDMGQTTSGCRGRHWAARIVLL